MLDFDQSSIGAFLKQKFADFQPQMVSYEYGTVDSCADGIVHVSGLSRAKYGELLEFAGDLYGIALDMSLQGVSAALLSGGSVRPGSVARGTGRVADVYAGDRRVGVLGQVHPLVAQNYGVDAQFYCAELELNALMAAKGADPEYVPLPKFPNLTRDIAVVCDEAVTVGALEACIRKGAKGLLKECKLFDIYRGKGVDEGKKSVAFNLILRSDDRSLTSEEADEDVKSILEALEKELGAVLR